jgi:hypothetical protein
MTTKYDNAVDRATGNKGGKDAGTEAPMVVGNTGAMIGEWKPEDLNGLAATGKVEFAPQMMALEPGQKIEGILEGEGPGNDFVNEQTGEVRHVKSWIIRSVDGSMRISILSSAQLDRKVPPFVGGPIGIARDKDVKGGNGFKVGDYKVWGPKLPNGKVRDFTVPKMIETSATERPALPAGDVTQAAQPNGVQAAQAATPQA